VYSPLITDEQLRFDRLYQSFFDCYLRLNPVSATFIGRHEFDDRLPDVSFDSLGRAVDEFVSLLQTSRGFDPSTLTNRQRLDKKLIEGFLETQIWEYGSYHVQRGNPAYYTGEAVFGVLSTILTDYAPASFRFEAMARRMEAFPAFFECAKNNIDSSPTIWIERASRECLAGLDFLHDGLYIAAKEEGYPPDRLEGAARTAEAALSDFRTFLWKTLPRRENVAAGRDAFEMILRCAHFMEDNPEDYAEAADEEVSRATSYLKAHAEDFGAKSPDEALMILKNFHTEASFYLEEFRGIWQACHELCERNDLVTWPDFPLRYIERYGWANGCAPDLYFLNYRSPAAYARPIVHNYLVPPLPKNRAEQEDFLRTMNRSVIKSNHVVHHGSIGHHVQNWNAYHQTNSLIGQFAGCDCASRPAMLCSGTMIEGWAVYATTLMAEQGFFTPLEEYAETHSHRRMAARTVVDVKLHCGYWSLADAVDYYVTASGMPHDAAKSEAVKNSMFPGGAIIYLHGSKTIKTLRDILRARHGLAFSLRRFHDAFLSFGSIPVNLVREELEKRESL
jgi:hypothetical protein